MAQSFRGNRGPAEWLLHVRSRCVPVSVVVALLLIASVAAPVLAVPPLVTEPSPYEADWPTVHWVISTKCRSCHRPHQEERLDFSDYDTLMAACVDGDATARLVSPGNPEESELWNCICWNAQATVDSPLPDAPLMPPQEHEWLSAQQQAAVYRWIANGAHQFKSPDACRTLTELDFPSAQVCAGCHPKQYDEWSRSMHAYAQHSPIFEAFNLTLQERTSGTMGTFCTRCHTPLGTALGENGLRRNVHRSRLSLEGVTCVACHRRSTRHYKNNGRLPIEPGSIETACMYGPFDASPPKGASAHPTAELPYLKSSQFCGECHDVVTPNGVRNEEAFSEWQRSPAARQGITCQSCHMGPVQGVPCPDSQRPLGRAASVPGVPQESLPLRRLSDHTFAGPDYSLLPDTEFPHKLDWMYEVDYRDPSNLTPYQQVTLRELRRRNRQSLATARDKRYELLAQAARMQVAHPHKAAPGDRLMIHVDIQSLISGHHFPTGFVAERQAWIAIEVRAPTGQLVFASGDLDANGDLRDAHSHDVLSRHLPHDRFLWNLQSKFTALSTKGTERSVVVPVNRHLMPLNILRPATEGALSLGRPTTFRVAKASLPPLKTLGRTYPLTMPLACGVYTVEARLRFRHLPPSLLDDIGTPHLKPLIEIVDLAEYHGAIEVRQAMRTPAFELWKGRR